MKSPAAVIRRLRYRRRAGIAVGFLRMFHQTMLGRGISRHDRKRAWREFISSGANRGEVIEMLASSSGAKARKDAFTRLKVVLTRERAKRLGADRQLMELKAAVHAACNEGHWFCPTSEQQAKVWARIEKAAGYIRK